ncbi:hypothetical protein JXB01_02690 [Candidatus Micrarchaeota archaeon]|nr:hypothetical protein [Candidatus Micrarchaeota archaeon]
MDETFEGILLNLAHFDGFIPKKKYEKLKKIILEENFSEEFEKALKKGKASQKIINEYVDLITKGIGASSAELLPYAKSKGMVYQAIKEVVKKTEEIEKMSKFIKKVEIVNPASGELFIKGEYSELPDELAEYFSDPYRQIAIEIIKEENPKLFSLLKKKITVAKAKKGALSHPIEAVIPGEKEYMGTVETAVKQKLYWTLYYLFLVKFGEEKKPSKKRIKKSLKKLLAGGYITVLPVKGDKMVKIDWEGIEKYLYSKFGKDEATKELVEFVGKELNRKHPWISSSKEKTENLSVYSILKNFHFGGITNPQPTMQAIKSLIYYILVDLGYEKNEALAAVSKITSLNSGIIALVEKKKGDIRIGIDFKKLKKELHAKALEKGGDVDEVDKYLSKLKVKHPWIAVYTKGIKSKDILAVNLKGVKDKKDIAYYAAYQIMMNILKPDTKMSDAEKAVYIMEKGRKDISKIQGIIAENIKTYKGATYFDLENIYAELSKKYSVVDIDAIQKVQWALKERDPLFYSYTPDVKEKIGENVEAGEKMMADAMGKAIKGLKKIKFTGAKELVKTGYGKALEKLAENNPGTFKSILVTQLIGRTPKGDKNKLAKIYSDAISVEKGKKITLKVDWSKIMPHVGSDVNDLVALTKSLKVCKVTLPVKYELAKAPEKKKAKI